MGWSLNFNLSETFHDIADKASKAGDVISNTIEDIVEAVSLPVDMTEETIAVIGAAWIGTAADAVNNSLSPEHKLYDSEPGETQATVHDFIRDGMNDMQTYAVDMPFSIFFNRFGLNVDLNSAQPYSPRDQVLEVEDFNDRHHFNMQHNAVDFNFILETGRVPASERGGLSIFGYRPNGNNPGLQYIDWDSDDSYTRSLEQVRQATFDYIENSQELQNLLNKDTWNMKDRETWERSMSEIVSRELQKIPGLDSYRIASDKELYPDTQRRVNRFNDLAVDIDNGTATREFDCEAMSVFEGVILQQAENHFLGGENSGLRSASRYFYATGSLVNPNSYEGGGHAFIVSEATGNIIEATSLAGNPYQRNSSPYNSFEDLMQGRPLTTVGGTMYILRESNSLDAEEIQEARNMSAKGVSPAGLVA